MHEQVHIHTQDKSLLKLKSYQCYHKFYALLNSNKLSLLLTTSWNHIERKIPCIDISFQFFKIEWESQLYVCEVPFSRLLLHLLLPLDSCSGKAVPHHKSSGNIHCAMQTLIQRNNFSLFSSQWIQNYKNSSLIWIGFKHTSVRKVWFRRKKLWGN